MRENIVYEICDDPIFGRRMALVGRCGLPKGHSGQCAIKVETKHATKQEELNLDLDLDLDEPHDPCDMWKPGRDIPLY